MRSDDVAMTGRSDQPLADLRARLAAMSAVTCDLAHERIAPDVARDPSSVASGFARPSLCAASRRRQNLACTHSVARNVLREALAHLAAERGDACAADLAALVELDAGLGPLDHRRYDAETRLAEARVAGDAAACAQAEAAIAEIKSAHRQVAATLAALQARALTGLDGALNETAANRVS